jgi:predicted ribonuclease YlaK
MPKCKKSNAKNVRVKSKTNIDIVQGESAEAGIRKGACLFHFRKPKGNPMSSSKKQKRPEHFSLRTIKPLNYAQQTAFEAWYADQHLLLHGVAGTGKTYLALYLALKEILRNDSKYNQIIIVRSTVPSRDMGFLPGKVDEKSKVYEEPYREICDDLFGRGDGYDILKMKKMVQFTTTSFLRGLTFKDAIVIVDECENMTLQELDTVITRVGDNTRIVFCGDYRQSDLQKRSDKEGLHTFLRILDDTKYFERVEFGPEDIVRSGLVRAYILSKLELGIT